MTVTRASATDRRETGARFAPFGLGVGAGVGVPGDRLVFGDLGFGQPGAGVEGPPVADRVLQLGEEPVRQRAGLERPTVLTAVDRPPDPVACPGAVAELLDAPEPDVVTVHLLLAPVGLVCPLLPGGAATRSARCAGPAPRRPAAAPPAGRLPAGASGRKPPGTPAARRSPHRSSAAGHPRFRALRPGWRRAAGSGARSRGRPVRGSATTDAPLRPPRQVRPPPGRPRRTAAWGCGETGKRKGRWRGRAAWRTALAGGEGRQDQPPARRAARRICHEPGWPRVPPLCPLLQKSGFQGLFSRAPGKSARATDTRGWLLQRSPPGPHAGAGCLTYCFAAQDS